MKYRRLGKTGLEVSEIGLGCWALGGIGYGPVSEEEARETLEAAWEHGVNFFDTADSYGNGESELRLGRFLAGKPRDKFFVATKGGHDFYDGPMRKNFDPAYLIRACEKSLERLGLDCIDVYQLHTPSPEVIQKEEVWAALQQLQAQGKIRFAGVSVYGEEEAELAMESDTVSTLQVVFNLFNQQMAQRIFRAAQERDIGIIAREPLACGMLSGKYNSESRFPKDDHRCGWSHDKMELDIRKIEKIKTILATKRFSLAQAAIEYVLEYEAVSTVIPGAKNGIQVLENVRASEDPRLRSQESSHLRDLYRREPLFREDLE